MRRADILSGIFLALAGLFALFAVIPAQISGHSDYGLAPDFFPKVLMWIFVALSVLLAGHRIYCVATSKPATKANTPPLIGKDWLFIAGFSVFMAVIYLVMKHVGFIVGGILAVATVSILMGDLRAHPIRMVLVAVIAPTIVYYGFKELFYVFLP